MLEELYFQTINQVINPATAFAANPLGLSFFFHDPHQDGSNTIPAGKSVEFRYRVFIHNGNHKQAQVAAKYKE